MAVINPNKISMSSLVMDHLTDFTTASSHMVLSLLSPFTTFMYVLIIMIFIVWGRSPVSLSRNLFSCFEHMTFWFNHMIVSINNVITSCNNLTPRRMPREATAGVANRRKETTEASSCAQALARLQNIQLTPNRGLA